MREQVVLLKDKPHTLAQLDALGFLRQVVHFGGTDADGPALRLQQPGDATQNGRFAGTRRADDRHRLSTVHVKVDAFEHRVVGERQVQIAQADQWRGDGFSRRHNVAPGVG
ncbi:hypothetical protein D3C85_1080270 [compost metagenome]